jgi:hypothetical protein
MKKSSFVFNIKRYISPAFFLLLILSFAVPNTGNAATYTVNRTVPDDNNPGSLRWCMNGANFNPGPDTIVFNIGTRQVCCLTDFRSLDPGQERTRLQPPI